MTNTRLPRLGHNQGPPLDPMRSWRRHCWKAARKALFRPLPLEVVRRRVARAARLGLAYRRYELLVLGGVDLQLVQHLDRGHQIRAVRGELGLVGGQQRRQIGIIGLFLETILGSRDLIHRQVDALCGQLGPLDEDLGKMRLLRRCGRGVNPEFLHVGRVVEPGPKHDAEGLVGGGQVALGGDQLLAAGRLALAGQLRGLLEERSDASARQRGESRHQIDRRRLEFGDLLSFLLQRDDVLDERVHIGEGLEADPAQPSFEQEPPSCAPASRALLLPRRRLDDSSPRRVVRE